MHDLGDKGVGVYYYTFVLFSFQSNQTYWHIMPPCSALKINSPLKKTIFCGSNVIQYFNIHLLHIVIGQTDIYNAQ